MRRQLFLLATLAAAFMVLFTGTDYAYHGCLVDDSDLKLQQALTPVIPPEGSVLFYPYSGVRRALLAADSNIYRIQYAIDFNPPIRLKVRVSKRMPQVVLKSKNQWYGMDRSGAVFPLHGRIAGYPTVALAGVLSFKQMRQLQEAMKDPALPKFSSVRIDQSGGLTFSTKEGIIIRVPSLAGIDERFKVLAPLLQVIREKKIRSAYIDLSSEEMPVFRVLSKR